MSTGWQRPRLACAAFLGGRTSLGIVAAMSEGVKSEAPAKRPGTLKSLALAMASWRTASVALLSFASGLPLGLVWIAIPDWMRSNGVDIRVVGLVTLAQAPWS